MDSLVESASTYAEVLRNCSSVKVAEWKQEDLERAVNWAEYFKRVNARLQKKPALVRKFDAQLKEISSQTGGRFAQKTLSTEFLGNSLDYLIMSLLENPYLPEGIKELVHQKYATEDHHKHTEKYASTQALFDTLTAIHNKLSKHAPSFLKRNPLLVACAGVLEEELEWILSHSQTPHTLAHGKLNQLVQQENGMEVILFSIISRIHPLSSSSASSVEPSTASTLPPASSGSKSITTAIVLEWLELCLQAKTSSPNGPLLQSAIEECSGVACRQFWTLSPELLAGVAAQSVDFFRIFYKMLVLRVNQIQTELLESFERDRDCTECTGVGYLDRLEAEALCYFRALMSVDERVREITVALVDSQVQETAAKILTIGITSCPADSLELPSPSVGLQSSIKLPPNLWRNVLAIADQ